MIRPSAKLLHEWSFSCGSGFNCDVWLICWLWQSIFHSYRYEHISHAHSKRNIWTTSNSLVVPNVPILRPQTPGCARARPRVSGRNFLQVLLIASSCYPVFIHTDTNISHVHSTRNIWTTSNGHGLQSIKLGGRLNILKWWERLE